MGGLRVRACEFLRRWNHTSARSGWESEAAAASGRGVAWLASLVENEARLGVGVGAGEGRDGGPAKKVVVSWGTAELQRVLEGFGSPQNGRGPWAYEVVRVAGSKGKGTVARGLSAVVQKSGYRVGLFTSPHTRTVRERVAVNGVMVSAVKWEALADACRVMCESLGARLTRFEAMTAMALVHFREEKVDVAVLECGLGGKEDATAVAVPPLLSVVTGVEPTEHREQLGGKVEGMWSHKIGVAHKGRPVILGPASEGEASAGGQQPWGNFCSEWGRSRYGLPMALGIGAWAIGVQVPRHDEPLGGCLGEEDVWMPSSAARIRAGGGGLANAATVASAAEVLAATVCPKVTPAVVAEVLEKQIRRSGTLRVHPDKDLALALDSAHSPGSSAAAAGSPLGRALRERPGGLTVVVAMARDKDARGFAFNLGKVDRLIVTEVPVGESSDRSMPARALAAAFEEVRPGEAESVTVMDVDPELNARLALAEAFRLAPHGSAILVTGSNHLHARALAAVEHETNLINL